MDDLVRLWSAELLPRIPRAELDVSLRTYLLQLHNYLRRLGGVFSAQNVARALTDAGHLGQTQSVHWFDFSSATTKTAGSDLRGKYVTIGLSYRSGTPVDAATLDWSQTTPIAVYIQTTPGGDVQVATLTAGNSYVLWIDATTGAMKLVCGSYSTREQVMVSVAPCSPGGII